MAIEWTNERKQVIRDLWATCPVHVIAERLGIEPEKQHRVRQMAFKMGLRNPVPPYVAPVEVAPPPPPPPTICRGWTHDPRYMLAPGTKPPPLFSAVPVGCDLDGRPWEARA